MHDQRWHEEATLTDGTHVLLRLVTPEDKQLLVKAFDQLSPESRFLRFFAAKTSLTPSELSYLTEMDQQHHLALGAMKPDGSEGLGIARFVCLADRPDTAEAAIVVVEQMRRRGLGRILLEHLVAAARERGVTRFRCQVLARNEVMRSFLDQLGPPIEVTADGDVLTFEWALPDTIDYAAHPVSHLLKLAAEGLLVLRHALFPNQERS